MKKYLRTFLTIVSQNKLVYLLAKRVVFDHRAENNCDIDTNGEMRVLKDYLAGESPVVFDVGANQGDWTKTVLQINGHSIVHAFEPSLKTFEILSANNFPENIHLNNLGLGSAVGSQEFFSYGDGSTVNSLYERGETVETKAIKETVNIGTLDNYCLDNQITKIDFLKIDVEGNELEVLKGAERLLKSGQVQAMQIEYGGTYIDAVILLKDVFDYLNGCGEYLFYKIHFNHLEEVSYHKDLENFQYCNYLVVKK